MIIIIMSENKDLINVMLLSKTSWTYDDLYPDNNSSFTSPFESIVKILDEGTFTLR